MKKIYVLLSLTLFLSTNIFANTKDTLTVYTYDSFVSEWGPGPIIKEIFEEKFDANLELIAVDSAATLLSKIILEGKTSKADVVLGLDMNLLDAANKSDLFQKHSYIFGLIVNVNGERFVDEGADFRNYTYAKYGREILNQPQRAAFQIFDQKTSHLLRDEYFINQVTKFEANTIAELAQGLDIDPDGLEKTLSLIHI
mgnify:CR=1 FL=1